MGKLYKLDCELAVVKHTVEDVKQHAALVLEDSDIDLWYQRLGHLCDKTHGKGETGYWYRISEIIQLEFV